MKTVQSSENAKLGLSGETEDEPCLCTSLSLGPFLESCKAFAFRFRLESEEKRAVTWRAARILRAQDGKSTDPSSFFTLKSSELSSFSILGVLVSWFGLSS